MLRHDNKAIRGKSSGNQCAVEEKSSLPFISTITCKTLARSLAFSSLWGYMTKLKRLEMRKAKILQPLTFFPILSTLHRQMPLFSVMAMAGWPVKKREYSKTKQINHA